MFKEEESKQNSLAFTSEVLNAFNFLIKEFGFHDPKVRSVVMENQLKFVVVNYQSRFVFVEIYYDLYSFELEFNIGQLNRKLKRSGETYSLGEILEPIQQLKYSR